MGRFRALLSAMVVFVGACLLFAQGSGKSNQPVKTEKHPAVSGKPKPTVQLVLFDWPFDPNIKLNHERIALFEKQNSDIKVRLVSGLEEIYDKMVIGGKTPDVAIMGYSTIPFYARHGVIMALDKFIARDTANRKAILAIDKLADPAARRKAIMAMDKSIADKDAKRKAIQALEKAVAEGKKFNCASYFNIEKYYDPDKYFPVAMKSVRYRGKFFGLPDSGSPVAIIYNKDLFDRYNTGHPDKPKLEYPCAKWNWEDFRHAAKALTQDCDGDGRTDVFGASIGFHRNRFPIYVWQHGGEVISKDKKRCLMDSPEAIAGIKLMHDILWVDKSAPAASTLIEGIIEPIESVFFMEQRIAMMLTTRYAYSKLLKKGKSLKEFEWDVAPPPKGPAGNVSVYIGCGWMISAKTRHPQEAWRLAKFLVGDKSSEMTMRSGNAISANMTVAKRMLKHPGTAPKHDHIWIDVTNNSRHKDFEFRIGASEPMFDKAMGEIYEIPYGRRKPEQACRNFTRIFNKRLKEIWEKEGGL